jgi:hypothetical protein
MVGSDGAASQFAGCEQSVAVAVAEGATVVEELDDATGPAASEEEQATSAATNAGSATIPAIVATRDLRTEFLRSIPAGTRATVPPPGSAESSSARLRPG